MVIKWLSTGFSPSTEGTPCQHSANNYDLGYLIDTNRRNKLNNKKVLYVVQIGQCLPYKKDIVPLKKTISDRTLPAFIGLFLILYSI